MKTNFKNVITIYIKKDKKTLIENILNDDSTNADKANRIISIDDEKNNEEICDYVIDNNDMATALNEIIKLLKLN